MDDETFKLTVIALLTELVENTRPDARSARRRLDKAKPEELVDAIARVLVDYPDGAVLGQIMDGLKRSGVQVESVRPTNRVQTILYRENQRDDPVIVIKNKRYYLRTAA